MLPDLLFRIRAQGDTARAFAATRGEVEKTRASFVGLGKAIAGGFGIGAGMTLLQGLPRLIKGVVDEASGLVNAADRIGITTERLQELQHTAGLADIEFSTLTGNLEQFTRRVADASQGSGELLDLLNANGVALRDQNGQLRSVGDMFDDVADLIDNSASAQDKMNIAVMAFGRGGADMINLLDGGSDALKRSAEEAKKLGLVLEDDLVRAVEEIGDRWSLRMNEMYTDIKWLTMSTIVEIDRFFATVEARATNSTLGAMTGKMLAGGVPGDTAPKTVGELGKAIGLDGFGQSTTVVPPSKSGSGKTDAEREAERIERVSEALAFQQAQIGRTAREREIYNALQRAGIDASHEEAPAIMAAAGALYDMELAYDRVIDRADALRDAAGEFLQGFVQDLRDGESGVEALGNAFERLADRLISSGLDMLITNLFGAAGTAGTGTMGTIIGSLFGFAGGGSVIAGGAGGPDSQIFAAKVTPGERIDFTPPGSSRDRDDRPVKIVVEAAPTPYFDLRVREVSGEEAQKMTVAGIAANERAKARQQALGG